MLFYFKSLFGFYFILFYNFIYDKWSNRKLDRFFFIFIFIIIFIFLFSDYIVIYSLDLTLLLPLILLFMINLIPSYDLKFIRDCSLIGSLFLLILSFLLLLNIENSSYFSIYNEGLHWLGILVPFLNNFSLKISFISVLFLVLLNIINVICILLSYGWMPSFFSTKMYINIIIVIQFLCTNFFLSSNLLFFYIFFESVLIPMYLLIGVWGLRDRKIHASYQFFLYTFFGSLFMIVAIIILGFYMHSFELYFIEKYWWFFIEKRMFHLELILWFFLFLGFAIKVPMVPFHIWLPEAHVEAPTGGSIILAAILLKFGTFGFYRLLVELLPQACNFFIKFIIVLSLIAILYGSIINFVQIDLKKIIAYSSVSHMGYVTLGLVLDNPEGIVGALFMMISHGFISGSLFYIVGILYERYGTRNLFYYGGLKNIMPLYVFFFFLLTLANMNLPLTAGFVPEFLVLIGSGVIKSKIVIFLAAFGLITNGIYCIWLFNRLCFGNNINNVYKMEYKDLDRREFIILFLFTFFIVLLGVFPNGILYGLENEVYKMLWSKNIFFS
jgi:proton-translocating NADH-quinone oxidoreductase chain M